MRKATAVGNYCNILLQGGWRGSSAVVIFINTRPQ